MTSTKIKFEEMQGLIARSVILANKENELKFLRIENKQYWRLLVKKYKLDSTLDYDINQSENILIWKKEKL